MFKKWAKISVVLFVLSLSAANFGGGETEYVTNGGVWLIGGD